MEKRKEIFLERLDMMAHQYLNSYRAIQSKTSVLIGIISIQFPILYFLFSDVCCNCLRHLLLFPFVLLTAALIL
jgi:hypothetical protein